MKMKTVYFIAYYGQDHARAWDADGERFVPYGMHLYITYFDKLDDVMREMRKVRKAASGWYDGIYIDSKLVPQWEA